MRIAVIGGGPAGLAAADELLRLGHEVLLFERGATLGGQLRTIDVQGTPLECFYHHLFTSDTLMAGLIEDMGFGEQLQWIPSTVGFFAQGRIWDFVTPKDLLAFQPLAIHERVRLGLASLYLQRQPDWRRFEPYTAEAWLKQWAGDASYRVVWEPLLHGKFGDAAPSIGMAWFQWKMRLRFGSRRGLNKEYLGYLVGSFRQAWEALGRRIETGGSHVFTQAQVQRIRVQEGVATGIQVAALPQDAASRALAQGLAQSEDGGLYFPVDAVVATIPSPIVMRLAPELPESYTRLLTQNRYQAIQCMVLVLKQPLSHIYWLNISDRSIPFVAVVEHTNLISPEHYGGKHVVYLSHYISKDDPLYQASEQEVWDAYRPHLSTINPAFQPEWVEEWQLFREDAAQPIITTNYAQKIPPLATPIKQLYMANNTQVYPEDRGQNYSIRIGRAVARLAGDAPPATLAP